MQAWFNFAFGEAALLPTRLTNGAAIAARPAVRRNWRRGSDATGSTVETGVTGRAGRAEVLDMRLLLTDAAGLTRRKPGANQWERPSRLRLS